MPLKKEKQILNCIQWCSYHSEALGEYNHFIAGITLQSTLIQTDSMFLGLYLYVK